MNPENTSVIVIDSNVPNDDKMYRNDNIKISVIEYKVLEWEFCAYRRKYKRTGTKNSMYIEAWFGFINVDAGNPK